MPRHVYLFSGASAVGKTSALKALLPLLEEGGTAPCVCKIDCLKTGDGALFQRMGLPCVTGLSGDICPDHFLVSNLPELWDWADRLKRDTLVIETAGLCHRCSPATQHMTAGCVLDCTASCRRSGQLGQCSPRRTLWCSPRSTWSPRRNWRSSPGRSGRSTRSGAFSGGRSGGLWNRPFGPVAAGPAACGSFEGDILRHTMPSGVCSYCVGEQRVGSAFQQGVVGKINFEEAEVCSL